MSFGNMYHTIHQGSFINLKFYHQIFTTFYLSLKSDRRIDALIQIGIEESSDYFGRENGFDRDLPSEAILLKQRSATKCKRLTSYTIANSYCFSEDREHTAINETPLLS